MRKILTKICKRFELTLLEEVKDGDKRYDFYLPTLPPIVIEVDGSQHKQTKADGFFFKDDKSLSDYKKNDAERNLLNKLGRIKLYRFTTSDDISLESVLNALDVETLNGGDDERNIHKKRKDYQEKNKRSKSDASNNKSNGDRSIKKLPRYSSVEHGW
jgi:hypothetical protein